MLSNFSCAQVLGLQNASLQSLYAATGLTYLHLSAASKVTDVGMRHLGQHTELRFLGACDLVSVTTAGWRVSPGSSDEAQVGSE